MPTYTYAGIGSRKTPDDVLKNMKILGTILGGSDTIPKSYTLRSGGAAGADTAFEIGCDASNGAKEIYLPWSGFNGKKSQYIGASPMAFNMTERFHPNWHALSPAAKKLMARNVYQVLGHDLKTPADFIVCWTPNGTITGGTGQALRMAKFFKIPVFNLANETLEDVLHYVKQTTSAV